MSKVPPSPMRVLQIAQKPQRRGAETFAWELSQWLESEGHATRMVYLYPYEGDQRLPLRDGDAVLGGNEASPFERVPGVDPRTLSRLRAVVREFRPDIIQVNGARSVKYGAALRALAPRAPWKLVYRNIDSPVFWVKGALRKAYYQKLVMPRLDGVVGVSEKTLAEVRDFYRLRCPHVFIPNGVNLSKLDTYRPRAEVRAELSTPVDAKVVLFFGALAPQKRPDRFLRVFRDIHAQLPDTVAWLLGDGPLRSESEALARELGIDGAVRFLGYQSDVASFVRAADLFLSTSDTEGIPAVVIEVGYCGLPTVAFAVGGMAECVLPGETGFLADGGDETALTRHSIAAFSQSNVRQLGQTASEYAAKCFAIPVVGNSYVTFYTQLQRSGTSR